MAEFFAYRIIEGKTTFDRVPEALRERVREILDGIGEHEPS